MKFKNSNQRKAVMARLMMNATPRERQILRSADKNLTYNQAIKRKVKLSPNGDIDKDGVKNSKDCKPFDPKKQGILHDYNVKRLRKQEEKLEQEREREQKKLEDLKDTLKEKSAIANKKNSVKELQLKQKQAIINEINKEKAQLSRIEEANREASRELDKYTITGKAKTIGSKIGKQAINDSRLVAQSTVAFFQKKSTKKALKNIKKQIFG